MNRFQFSQRPVQHQFKIANEDTINVDIDKFNGDVDAAIAFVQGFCNANSVCMEGDGFGNNTLTMGNKTHEINRYCGIDLDTMIEYCGGNPHDFKKKLDSASSFKP